MEAQKPELPGARCFPLSDFLKSRFEVQTTLQVYKNKPGDGCKFSTESQKLNLKTEARQGQASGTGLLMAFSLSACTFSVMQLHCVYNKELDFLLWHRMHVRPLHTGCF